MPVRLKLNRTGNCSHAESLSETADPSGFGGQRMWGNPPAAEVAHQPWYGIVALVWNRVFARQAVRVNSDQQATYDADQQVDGPTRYPAALRDSSHAIAQPNHCGNRHRVHSLFIDSICHKSRQDCLPCKELFHLRQVRSELVWVSSQVTPTTKLINRNH